MQAVAMFLRGPKSLCYFTVIREEIDVKRIFARAHPPPPPPLMPALCLCIVSAASTALPLSLCMSVRRPADCRRSFEQGPSGQHPQHLRSELPCVAALRPA